MGSEIVTTTVEQKGRISTNPGGFSPSSSRPLQQIGSLLSSSTPLEQLSGIKTSSVGGVSTSRPVEQIGGVSFNEHGTNPDDCFIEQIKTERATGEAPDTPIEQLIFVTSNLRVASAGLSQAVEQRSLTRNAVGDEALEQTTPISNQINITQFNFSDLIFPPCNSTKNPVDTDILWRVRDYGFRFDIETIVFTVQGIPVQNYSGFTVTALVNGMQIDYNPSENFDYDEEVEVTLTVSDNATPPNTFFYRCRWRTVEDSRPPIISLVSPECGTTNVDVAEPVIFQVLDVGEGVDQDSINLYVEGVVECDLSFSSITTSSGSGYTVTWDHTDEPFRYDSNVTVAIKATDLSPLQNSAFFVCSFDTEESQAPEFINFDPAECASFVDNRTGLYFEIYGNVDGVDISTLEVRIDNKLRKVYVRPRIYRSV